MLCLIRDGVETRARVEGLASSRMDGIAGLRDSSWVPDAFFSLWMAWNPYTFVETFM
jgi:hypothetical protein